MPETDEAAAAFLKALGAEIRSWRLRRAMSREELAAEADISPTTLGRIERQGPVDVGDTWRIARALGVSLEVLIARTEEALAFADAPLAVAHGDDADAAQAAEANAKAGVARRRQEAEKSRSRKSD